MGLAVTTVASGGLPVADMPAGGLPVTESTSGLAVTKVAASKAGLPVTYVSAGGGGGGTPLTPTTWNPSDKSANIALSNGNLTATSSAVATGVRGIVSHNSGKYYWEITYTTAQSTTSCSGLALASAVLTSQGGVGTAVLRYDGSVWINNASVASLFGNLGAGTVVGMAFDLGANLCWFRKGAAGNWNASAPANPATGTGGISFSAVSGTLYPVFQTSAPSEAYTANFGASSFSGNVPEGFIPGWGDGGTPVAYATWSPTDLVNMTVSGGNLTATASGAGGIRSTKGVSSGKYYFEVKLPTWAQTSTAVGVMAASATLTPTGTVDKIYMRPAGTVFSGGTVIAGFDAGDFVGGDTVGIAVELSAGVQKFWFRKCPSGPWNNASEVNGPATGAVPIVPAPLLVGALFPCFVSNFAAEVAILNAGSAVFSGAVPAGFTPGIPG